MNCPQCNTWLPDGIKFCSSCGAALTNNTVAQAAPPQPESQMEYQPEPQANYEPEPQTAYQPEPQVNYEPEPQTKYQPEPQVNYEPEPQTAYQPEPAFTPNYQYPPHSAQQYSQPTPQYNYQYNQQPQYSQPIYSNRREITEDELPEKFSPLGAWAYFGLKLLFCIPIVGLVFLIVFSFNDGNRARRNFARSYWCELLVFTIILLVLVIIALAGVGSLGYYF